MNPDLDRLQAYPFEKLRQLFKEIEPNAELAPISLGMGEPRHRAPAFVREELIAHLDSLANYPATRGIPELRAAITHWLQQRFQLAQVDPETQVLPVSGTREALFAIAQAVVDRERAPLVLSPNPFYQIYEGAALLAGATPMYLDCRAETDFLPDFSSVSEDTLQRCQLLYICNPGNPSGATMSLDELRVLLLLAREHNFVIASDECYSEIYRDERAAPAGLLQAAESITPGDYSHCVVFHSLSKRSNLPGLRSGFVAGDESLLEKFLLYRSYQGCALPVQHQWASAAAWADEQHVKDNRERYREKFSAVLERLGEVLNVQDPGAGFYLWPQTPVSDTEFAAGLYQQQHLTVLPGSFLGRDAGAGNPGANRVRMALVATLDECVSAAERIRRYMESG